MGPTVLAISVVNILERKVFYFILQLAVHHARQEPRGRIPEAGFAAEALEESCYLGFLFLTSSACFLTQLPQEWLFPQWAGPFHIHY